MTKVEFIFDSNANRIIGALLILYGVFQILGI